MQCIAFQRNYFIFLAHEHLLANIVMLDI